MQRDQVIDILTKHRAHLRSLGVQSLALFGSVARDEARSDSDVDILVDLEPPVTFDCYMNVKLYLEDHLGTKVDVVMRKSLHPLIRSAVEQEMIYVT